MKTFKQYLAEAEALSFPELLRGPCAPFFRQSQRNGLLIRGMKGFGQPEGEIDVQGVKFKVYRKAVRKDRHPMDTAKALSVVIDDWFEENHGIRARSEAVFCFGEAGRLNAYMYGDLCAVLPIGKFTYVWSPKVADLYDDIILGKIQHDGDVKAPYLGPDGKPDPDIIGSILDDLDYTINGFDKAVASTGEVMIDCDEYFVIPLEKDHNDSYETHLGILKKAFVHA